MVKNLIFVSCAFALAAFGQAVDGEQSPAPNGQTVERSNGQTSSGDGSTPYAADAAYGVEPSPEELKSVDESLETVRRICHDTLAVILAELQSRYPGINARQSAGRSKKNDYRNYQWISVKFGEREYLITIHHNNIDLRTGNPHTQYGRLQFWKCAGPNGPHTRDDIGVWRFRYENAWAKMPRIRVWDEDYSSARIAELFVEYLREEGLLAEVQGTGKREQGTENGERGTGNGEQGHNRQTVKPSNCQTNSAAAIATAEDLPLAERRKVDEALENVRKVEAKAMWAIVRELRTRHPDWKVRTSHGNSKVNDYRNYQWITVRIGEKAYWICLMTNDLDSFTGNTHTQYGRIQFWRDINKENGPKNEAGPHTRDHGAWRFRYDKQWKEMPRLHLWDEAYSSAHVVDLFERFVGQGGGAEADSR